MRPTEFEPVTFGFVVADPSLFLRLVELQQARARCADFVVQKMCSEARLSVSRFIDRHSEKTMFENHLIHATHNIPPGPKVWISRALRSGWFNIEAGAYDDSSPVS